jgi:hypothetical protein
MWICEAKLAVKLIKGMKKITAFYEQTLIEYLKAILL